MSILSTLLLLFVVIVLSVIITQTVIIPVIINYEHGLFLSPDFTISNSPIQGLGLYTKRKRSKGEKLFVSINSNKDVTPIGSKINHCPSKGSSSRSVIPNTYLSTTPDQDTGEWWIIAARDIALGEELTVDYTHTPDFIKKPDPSWKCEL
jgi:hypothetical protein